jgi:hypothetical protein
MTGCEYRDQGGARCAHVTDDDVPTTNKGAQGGGKSEEQTSLRNCSSFLIKTNPGEVHLRCFVSLHTLTQFWTSLSSCPNRQKLCKTSNDAASSVP